MELYRDNYCVIEDMGNGRALWATRYLDCQTMPLLWAKKVINYLNAGNIEAGYKLIDMVEIRWNNRRKSK